MSPSVNPLPERLEQVAHQIALEMRADLPKLAEAWIERMSAEPDLARWTAPEFRELGLRNARVDIGREVEGLVCGRVLPARCPPEVIDSARLGVAMGYPLWAAMQAYRAGHAVQWRAWTSRIEALSLAPEDRRQLLQAGSDYMFAYADRSARWMEIEYSRARDERMRGDEQRRIQLVRDLLDGRATEAPELGYELDAWHIGLIVTGEDAGEVGQQLAAHHGAQLLTVAADLVTWWAWLGLEHPPGERLIRQLRSVGLPAGHAGACGHPGYGAAGFVKSHAEARRTIDLTYRLGGTLASHDDVALEDLATANPERAREFLQRELGALADDSRRSRILRETLQTYFSAAQTASAAARILGVHERTIGNRLRTIEHITGHAISHRRAELETALRLHRVLRA